MKTLVRILAILIVFSVVSACKKAGKTHNASQGPIQSSRLSILDYDSLSVTLLLEGTLAISSVSDLDVLEVYTNSSCSGSRAGASLVRDFTSEGVEISLPSDKVVPLYVTTVGLKNCLFSTEFNPHQLAPKAPVFKEASPPSPTRETFEPGFFGSAWPSSALVKFFDNESCTASVGSGSANDYASVGVKLSLTPNAVTRVFALTEDPFGRRSDCVSLTEYRHANLVLPNPVFKSVAPASPNNQTNQPIIKGEGDPLIQKIELFSDVACSESLATGTLSDFQAGLTVTLSSNVTNVVYAQGRDDLDNRSPCTFMTFYVHDTVGPDSPTFISAMPASPTNQTTSPLLTGTAPSDSLVIKFYDTSLCLSTIGNGASSDFTGAGLAVNLPSNEITSVFGKSFDAAGNGSACVYLTDYKHNTIPPDAPTFGGTTPAAPTNGTTEPLVFGTPSDFTINLNFYSDENCNNFIGSGSETQFENSGIAVTLSSNTYNTIYSRVYDLEGNESNCHFLGTYDHRNLPAPSPGFVMTFPSSPNRTSTSPYLIGSADNTISTVSLFGENSCATPIGSGTRAQFISSGIQIVVPSNSTTDIYAVATDVYGNLSSCTYLTQYIHNTVPPLDPTFISVSPTTPNNDSYAPTLSGTALPDPSSQLSPNQIKFYDSGICVNKLGEGIPSDYSTTGIKIGTYRNAVTSVYARSFDAAGNASNCTFMLDYTHDDLLPGAPYFSSTSPFSPSFVPEFSLFGYYGTSTDFLNKVGINIYSDSSCNTLIASGAPDDFTGAGLSVTVPVNQVTSLYGDTVNEVGTKSACNFLTSYQHYDLPPENISAISGFDGTVKVSWNPDPVSSPILYYTVERATSSLGPFTVLETGGTANSYEDKRIVEGQKYFYRVFTSNVTGRSQYSGIAAITVSSPSPTPIANLVAYPGPGEVDLMWSGFPQNMFYKIFRATQRGGPFVDLGVNTSVTNYKDLSANIDTTYYYYVVGTNPSGDSVQSNIAQAYPKAVPSAPTNLVIKPILKSPECGGTAGIYLAWSAPAYYDLFQIRRSLWGGTLATTTNSHYVICEGSFEGTSAFNVRAQWGDGYSLASVGHFFAKTSGVPLTAYSGNGEVVLKWSQNEGGLWYDNWGARYDIYKATSPDGPFEVIQSDYTAINYTDVSVVNGNDYFYYIQAFTRDPSSNKRLVGFPSVTRSVTTRVDPGPPTNLILNYDESLGIKLDWKGSGYQNYFRIYGSSSLAGPYSLVGTSNQNYLYGAPASEGMNYFRVTSAWGSNETAPTNTVSYRKATIFGLDATSTSTDIQLDWFDVVDVQNYEVFRASMISGPYISMGVSNSSDYIDTSVAAGQGYYYKVQARFGDGTAGALSSSVRGMPTGSSYPSGVSASNITANSFSANWAEVPGAMKYEVHVATVVGGPYSLKSQHASLTTQSVSGLIPNTEYFFFVRALVSGTNYDSSPATVTTRAQPSAPFGTARDGEINLSWTPSIGASNYDVLRSTDGRNFTVLVSSHPTSSFLDTSVTNGVMYFYKLKVNYSVGSMTSMPSTGLIPGVIPPPPANLSVKSDGTGSGAMLSWGMVDGVNRFNVYRSTSPGGPFTSPILTTSGFEDIPIQGLTTGTTYYFQIRSRNGDLVSAPTGVVGFIPGLNQTAPQVARANAGAVTLSWGVVTGADEYDLYRSETTSSFQLLVSGLTVPGYEDNTIDPAKTYFYYYVPKTSAGVRFAQSNTSAGVNVSIAPLAPSGFNGHVIGLSGVDLEWIKTPTAESYEIYRSSVSGGPYSLLGTVTAPSQAYTDSAVTGGSTYFYVIQAINSSRVHSTNSNELGFRLVSGPTGLGASNTTSGVEVTWNALSGASQYLVRRSDWSGGPYGLVGITTGTSFTDTEASSQKNYYYVVQAQFTDGSVSQDSSEATLFRAGVVDLAVPVEMLDQPASSASSENRVFERSKTFINTDYYDGTISFRWDLIAKNIDSTAREIRLRDGGDVLVSTFTIPAGTTVPTRYSQTISLTPGDENYRLELEQTTSDLQLSALNSRLVIEQVGASKTRLYFPLLTSEGLLENGDASVASSATTLSGFQTLDNVLSFRREAEHLDRIIDYNAWEIEALVSSSGGATGSIQFFNRSSGTPVPMTETNFNSNYIQRARVFIDEGVDQFNALNEDNIYEIQLRCDFNCDLGPVKLHKAGLWVRLENLTKAVVVLRNTGAAGDYTTIQTFSEQRAYLNLSQFSGEQVFFQAEVAEDSSSSANVELLSHGQDSGIGTLTFVSGSQLTFNADRRQILRSAGLSLSSGDRFITRLVPTTGSVRFFGSSLVIHITRP